MPKGFEVYRSAGGTRLWYWRLKGTNGKIIADGGEGYATRASAARAVKRLERAIVRPLIARVEVEQEQLLEAWRATGTDDVKEYNRLSGRIAALEDVEAWAGDLDAVRAELAGESA